MQFADGTYEDPRCKYVMFWRNFNFMAKCPHDRVKQSCSICKPELVYAAYVRKSKARNLTFRLTLEEFEQIISGGRCAYCGEYEVLGLDRVDNRIPYLKSNVVACCSECNFMKRDMDKHRFIRRATLIAAHQQEKLRRQKAAEVLVQPAA